jgi:hypothetical protein
MAIMRRMRSLCLRFLLRPLPAGISLGAGLWAKEEPPAMPPSKPPEAWQAAGLRAAFGDYHEPFIEPSLFHELPLSESFLLNS